MTKKLGKKPAVIDPRVPSLHMMMAPKLSIPSSSNWYAKIGDWGMYGNDNAGCCVEAGEYHSLLQRLTYANKNPQITSADVINLYSKLTGYNGTDATDHGTVMTEALASWAKDGIRLHDGTVDKLTSYVTVNYKSPLRVKMGISTCACVLMGITLPSAWMNVDSGGLWDLPDGKVGDIEGGHCVLLVGYEPTAIDMEYDVISWGARYRMTERAMLLVADEAYTILDADWLDKNGLNPAGIDWDAAEAAIKVIANS